MVDVKIIKAVFKGLLTFIPGVTNLLNNKKKTSKHSGSKAEFCYTLWLSILVLLKEQGLKPDQRKIGEIGSGGSIGVGLCALLSGCEQYYALEAEATFDTEQNLQMLEELIRLFREKTEISDNFGQLNIKVVNHQYPEHLIQPVFNNKRILEEIRDEIKSGFINSKRIRIIKNWEEHSALKLDFVFSRAVLEHVASPADVYKGMAYHLKSDSLMVHDIEFHSHGITKRIDGHYFIPDYIWRIIFGKRRYFLNRWSLQDHLNNMLRNSFMIINVKENKNYNSVNDEKVLIGAVITAQKKNE